MINLGLIIQQTPDGGMTITESGHPENPTVQEVAVAKAISHYVSQVMLAYADLFKSEYQQTNMPPPPSPAKAQQN